MSDGGDGGEWAASESKDWKDGRHRRENRHVLPHAGEIRDRDSRQALTAMRGAYERAYRRGWLADGWPSDVTETRTWRDRMAHHATEGFTEKLEEGDAAGIRHYVGSQEDEPDVSGLRILSVLEEIVTGDAAMFYIFGHMGNGKTMLASLLGEIWERNQPSDAVVATNSRTLDAADEWVSTWPELREWMHEPEEKVLAGRAVPKLMILDEASSHVSGRGRDGYDASTKLATMCYKMRKYGGSLVVIGHDGKDVHPAVREMCVAVHKTGKKTGQVYRSVSNRKGVDPITEPLKGIPLPDKSWQPNTNDLAPWSWTGPDGEEDVVDEEDFREMAVWTVIRCKQNGLSHRETAEYVPFGKSTVGRVWRQYEDGEKWTETPDRVTEVFA